MIEAWRLDLAGATLVFASCDRALPEILHWGASLPEDEDLGMLARALAPPLTPGVLDRIAALSVCPEEGRGFVGQPGIRVSRPEGGVLMTQFRLEDDTPRQDGNRLAFRARDAASGLVYTANVEVVGAAERPGLSLTASLVNEGNRPVRVDWLAMPVLPVAAHAGGFIDYVGRWTGEFREVPTPFARGVHLRENRRGRTSHDHFPGLIAVTAADHGRGDCWGIHFAWSGGHRMIVEELPDGRRQVQFGIAWGEGECILAPGEATAGDERGCYAAFSQSGRNGLAHVFHGICRTALAPRARSPRPVHYNCWEAVYFDHDIAVLEDLAERAAHLGAERFVLDDGWFGHRDDDTTSLGDWTVDRRKYPDGLTPLIEHAERLGMSFGLWVEPEMVNLDSDLARAHPDWLIRIEGLAPITGRNQHVLDLARDAAADHIFGALDRLLSDHRIAYLKWDMNRDLTHAARRERQTLAVYRLLDRLRAAHPSVEIETCASGGGRIDFGILKRADRVWLSDSNDAHERWRMQVAAMQFLPPEIVGSHVGPRRCHTSGRVLAMGFRAAVAMTGHMGFEMDLRELEDAEADTLARTTALYKRHRGWMHAGLTHRLAAATPVVVAQMVVAADGAHFLLFAATLEVPREESMRPLRLDGLEPSARYRLTLVNPEDIQRSATRAFKSPLLRAGSEGLVLAGATLMQAGLMLPFGFPDTMWIIEGERITR